MTNSNSAPGPLVLTEETSIKGVWKFLLNRPPANTMNFAMYETISKTLDELAANSDMTCLLVGSSTPGRFCGGADTKDLASLTSTGFSIESWEEREKWSSGMMQRFANFPCPTIAVIDGYAVGAGFVVASQCDIRICSDQAWFSIPELKVSRCGGAVHAMKVLPPAVVRELYYEASRLDVQRAYQLGFVNKVVPVDQLWDTALEHAGRINEQRPYTLRVAKKALNEGQFEPLSTAFEIDKHFSFRLAAVDRARQAAEN